MPTIKLLLVYRATFRMTFKEIAAGPHHYRLVIPILTANLVVGYFLAEFLRKSGEYYVLFLPLFVFMCSGLYSLVGPTVPHTFNNPEWEEASVERHLKQKANPITGISSKYSKHAQKAQQKAQQKP